MLIFTGRGARMRERQPKIRDFADQEISGDALFSPQMTIKDGEIVYRNMLFTD